jgi:hypothetical protein
MEGGDFDFTGRDAFKDAREQADACAVAKFGIFEAQVADFAQHGASVSVTMRIPTG